MALKYLLPGQMKFMKENGFEVIMISADGKEREDVIKNEKCRHLIVPMTRKITPLQDLKCLWLLIKIFRKEKPDIVHTHTPKAGLLGMMAAYICSVKVRIHTVAGLPLMVEKGFKLWLLKLVEKLTYASATYVWPNSYSLLQYIIENKFTKKSKLEVIVRGSSNGIDLTRFNHQYLVEEKITALKKSIQYTVEKIYLLFVGRMVADKGITELVNSFSTIQKNQPLLQLLLLGPYENELDPLPFTTIQQIENNPAITHINWADQVEYYMQLADYFIFPSHREGFPNVLLQAGAMHLPIVCSNIPGNIDIVKQNETGFLFEKGNEEALTKAISTAINNPANGKNMSANLFSIISSQYDQQKIWHALLKRYNELLSKS